MILRIKKIIVFHSIAIFLFVLAVLYITHPLIFNLGNYATGYGDEFVIAWIQNWVIHSLLSGSIFALFDANLYYPFLNSFAYSDLLITSSIFALVPLQIIREPVSTVNFTFLSSLILLGFSTYSLSYYLTKNFFLSVLSGMLVLFSPAVLDKVMHLQILAIYWVPLSILCFLHFVKTQRTRYLVITLIAFLLQTYNSFLPGYFIVVSLVILLLTYFFSDRKKIRKLFTKKNVGLVIVSFLLLLPIIIPYYQVSKEFHYVRDIRETIHFALQPEDFLYASDKTRLQPFLNNLPFNQESQNEEFKPGYIGFVFSILTIIAIFYSIRWFKKKDIIRNSLLCISSLGLILSLGPLLHFGRQTIHEPFPIPLPYALFYYVAPGFQGFRNSARWEMLFVIIVAILIALVLYQLVKRMSMKKQMLLFSILFIGVFAEFNFPMKFLSVPQIKSTPQVYQWLATTPEETSFIELPIYNWNQWPFTQKELFREYYGITHFRDTVNGYSGFSPPPWQNLVEETLVEFPSEKSIKQLQSLGIDYVIVHSDEYDALHNSSFRLYKNRIKSGDIIISELSKKRVLKLHKQFGTTYVYSF